MKKTNALVACFLAATSLVSLPLNVMGNETETLETHGISICFKKNTYEGVCLPKCFIEDVHLPKIIDAIKQKGGKKCEPIFT